MKNIFLSFSGSGLTSGLQHRDRDDRPYLFLLFSVIIHILILWAFTTIGGDDPLKLLKISHEPPLEIEILELPEYSQDTLKTPDKITAFAQRSQEVEKEEYPKKSDTISPTTPVPAAPPTVVAIISPGGGEQAGDGVKKRAPEKKTLDEITDEATMIREKADFAPSLVPEILRPESKPKNKAGVGVGAGEARARLFPTKGSLQQIAREERATVDSPKEGGGMTLLLNTAEFKYQEYFMNVRRRIQFYWEYPSVAARNGQQGRLNIDFVIHKDGVIETGGIDIIKSSNYPILDDAATTALRLASPFNPFPKNFDVEEITVHGSFEYSLIRSKR